MSIQKTVNWNRRKLLKRLGIFNDEKKWLRFNANWGIKILKEVIFSDANLTKHGELKTRFEEVLQTFVKQLLEGQWESTTKTKWGSISDIYQHSCGLSRMEAGE